MPVVVGVSETEQLPPESVQLVEPLMPLGLVQETVPVGVLVVPALVSLTVAVHVVAIPTPTGFGEQLNVVLVARFVMLKVLLVAPVRPELDAVSV